jgi:hypothetical protein
MSQTLALIVAAMVLMMTALTLIFMTQGSLQDLFSGSERQSCISTAETSCGIKSSGDTVNVPACNGAGVSSAGSNGEISIDSSTGTVTC